MKPKKTAKIAPSRREEVLTDFATLRIPVTAEQLDAALQQAQDAGLTHLDFLHRLLADQAGLLSDPERAASRMSRVLVVAGIA